MNTEMLETYINDCDKIYVGVGLNSKCTDDDVLRVLSLHTQHLARIVRDILRITIKENLE